MQGESMKQTEFNEILSYLEGPHYTAAFQTLQRNPRSVVRGEYSLFQLRMRES